MGTGGISAFYGARLLSSSNKVIFTALGMHLEAIKKNGLQVQHPDFLFSKKIDISQLKDINFSSLNIDVIILATKSNTTRNIAKELFEKLSSLVYGLMKETQSAARAVDVLIYHDELNQMYELIKNFDSIKPSMLVDREFKRELEIDKICNVVINYNKMQNIDSPYTKSISYLLDFIYKNEK